MDKKPERRGLGRGLSALMADINVDSPVQGDQVRSRQGGAMYAIEKIRPNPNQPRRTFDEAALATLADSIRQKGIIQPLILRPIADGTYEIVAGERRWRAAQIAQLHEIPAIVRDFDDTEVLEVAIIENIQRADLNAVEEALGYRQLMDRFGHTQEKIAEALSRSRSHIANLLRLLNLPEDVLDLVRTSQLSAGHARALITTRDPSGLAKLVIAKDLSVRQTEELVRKLDAPQSEGAKAKRAGAEKDADTKALENDLSAGLSMKVVISHNASSGGGALTIDYASLDDLDWLCGALSARQRPVH
ncbi:MAG: ParB/RepB/Spo0J family partition protein [Microgenomates group bacterium]